MIDQPDLPFRIERTRNRHSRASYKNGVITIRLARSLSQQEEQNHIDSLLRRMSRHVARLQDQILIDPFRRLLDGESECTVSSVMSAPVTIRLEPSARSRTKTQDHLITLGVPPHTKRDALHKKLWRVFSEFMTPDIERFVRDVNDGSFRVPLTKIKVTYASSQWGSYTPPGRVMLNAALFCTTPEIAEYVVIHELAHDRFRHHGPAFWKHVQTALPDLEARKTALRQFRISEIGSSAPGAGILPSLTDAM